jgi:hypothetical protein
LLWSAQLGILPGLGTDPCGLNRTRDRPLSVRILVQKMVEQQGGGPYGQRAPRSQEGQVVLESSNGNPLDDRVRRRRHGIGAQLSRLSVGPWRFGTD